MRKTPRTIRRSGIRHQRQGEALDVGKRFDWVGGALVKGGTHVPYDPNGVLHNWDFDNFRDYVAWRREAGPDVMLIAGTWNPGLVGNRLERGAGKTYARNKKTTRFDPDHAAICPVDFDKRNEDETQGLAIFGEVSPQTPAELFATVADLLSDLGPFPAFGYASSSGGIIGPDGALVKPATTFRLDIGVASGADVPRLLHLLHVRSLARRVGALGFLSNAVEGHHTSFLVRSVADQMLARPMQPDFTAPLLRDGLTQDRDWSLFNPDAPLLAGIPDPTPAERKAAKDTEQELRGMLRPKIDAHNERADAAYIARHMAKGISRAEAERRLHDWLEGGAIYDEDELLLPDGSPITGREARTMIRKGGEPITIWHPGHLGDTHYRDRASLIWNKGFRAPAILTHGGIEKKFTFSGHPRRPVVPPGEPPRYPPPSLPRDEAARRIRDGLAAFLARPDGRLLVRATQGSGKTRELFGGDAQPGQLHGQAGKVVLAAFPTHELAGQACGDYEAARLDSGVGARGMLLKGRAAVDPAASDGEPLCREGGLAEQVARLGGSVPELLCKTCRHRVGCAYLRQVAGIRQAALSGAGVVIFGTHAHLHAPLLAGLPEADLEPIAPDLIVVDERPGDFTERVAFNDADAGELATSKSKGVRALGHFLQRHFGTDQPGWEVPHHIGKGQVADMQEGLDRVRHKALREVVKAARAELDATGGELMRAALARRAGVLLDALIRDGDASGEFSIRPGVNVWLDPVQTDPEAPGDTEGRRGPWVRAAFLRPLFHAEVPVILLDGSADPEVTRLTLGGPCEVVDARTERNAIVHQVIGGGFGKTRFDKDKDADGISPQARLVAGYIRRVRADVVFCAKQVRVQLEKLLEGSGVAFGHFNALRGKNHWQDRKVAVVVGQVTPSLRELEANARALAARAGDGFTPAEEWERKVQNIRKRNGQPEGSDTLTHPDPWAAREFEQIREAEVVQAADRLRLVHNTEAKRIDLLTDVPADITVDEVLDWAEVGRRDRLAETLALTGAIPSGPELARKVLPLVWDVELRQAQREFADLEAWLDASLPERKQILVKLENGEEASFYTGSGPDARGPDWSRFRGLVSAGGGLPAGFLEIRPKSVIASKGAPLLGMTPNGLISDKGAKGLRTSATGKQLRRPARPPLELAAEALTTRPVIVLSPAGFVGAGLLPSLSTAKRAFDNWKDPDTGLPTVGAVRPMAEALAANGLDPAAYVLAQRTRPGPGGDDLMICRRDAIPEWADPIPPPSGLLALPEPAFVLPRIWMDLLAVQAEAGRQAANLSAAIDRCNRTAADFWAMTADAERLLANKLAYLQVTGRVA
ncbi:hypothetical protein [Paracoccus sp. PAR01]|uniref:hypothetical protein n=1 Tax=Paracoccus sp. PAR01 TaxID=2769282 RepID=UPI00177EDDDA|nr:hypothetical protein [Paracoccus sp. PAR01]MBD9526210.1 hypothetical protein [Paracoccus sp. PAR01]